MTLQLLKLNAANLYTVNKVNLEGIHFYLSSLLHIQTCSAKMTVRNCTVYLKFHCLELPLTKVSLSFIGNEFRSVTQSSQTRVHHEVALSVFCGILASPEFPCRLQ